MMERYTTTRQRKANRLTVKSICLHTMLLILLLLEHGVYRMALSRTRSGSGNSTYCDDVCVPIEALSYLVALREERREGKKE